MDEINQTMAKHKSRGNILEVILPDFPDDDNTVTSTVTKSKRVSFGTNFVKEFVVGSAISAQCVSEYEQTFSSSDSSNANSSHSTVENAVFNENTFVLEENPRTAASVESEETLINRPKTSSTICFSSDSPTADMEFTGGCISLAKSILDKKNKEMTVIIQAKSKESKEEVKILAGDETKYFEGSQFDMSMTKCFRSRENKREEKFESEKTNIFSEFDDEMSITRCDRAYRFKQSQVLIDDNSQSSWERDDCKENRVPLEMIIKHLDKDDSDLENFLFNPEKSLSEVLSANVVNSSLESENLNMNESINKTKEMSFDQIENQKHQLPHLNDNEELPVNPISNNLDQTNFNQVDMLDDSQLSKSEISITSFTITKGSAEAGSTSKQAKLSESHLQPQRPPSLFDSKAIESLKKQSSEPGCTWSLQLVQFPQHQNCSGMLSCSFQTLESLSVVTFTLKSSNENAIDSCSTVSDSKIIFEERKQLMLPEYKLVAKFGYEKLSKYFEEVRNDVRTIRDLSYFLDQMNLINIKINARLRQLYSILTLYPGSRLEGSSLSFRLFSFPILFSCTVIIDLTDWYRLYKSNVTFKIDFGSFSESKILDIFDECSKCENSLYEFIIRSTKYLIEIEKKAGFVSKRRHIRLLPADFHL